MDSNYLPNASARLTMRGVMKITSSLRASFAVRRSPGRTAGAPKRPPVIPASCGQPSNGPDARRFDDMSDTWETTVRTAATTMLRYPDKISDDQAREDLGRLSGQMMSIVARS